MDRARDRGFRDGRRAERRDFRRDRRDFRRDRRDFRRDRRDYRRDFRRADRRAYNRGFRHGYRNGNFRRWDRGWRSHRRYNWRGWRGSNRHVFRLGRYYAPFRAHRYNRFRVGFFLDSVFFQPRYYIHDPWAYRLPQVYGPYRWVRYYDDVALVDIYTGEVVDVIYDFFW
ncbi:RcnB family protein [Erythrobacter sp. KMU-140]|uniref:RcnB family protein n=1 Tax=Erythrobacter rubeus TaxID=2760803 RepID=A0ABR8KS59_9SPHN|nr:RcnB family protein [Erythrobacter rubeus]